MALVAPQSWTPRFPSPERSPGVHLSDVLDGMEAAFPSRAKYQADGDEYGEGYSLPGLVWETALRLEETPEQVIYHPGEVTQDGILMTPDGLILSPEYAIGEWKFTWKKWDGDFYPDNPRWWRWFLQVMSYCRAWGTRKAVFKVLFICGDYTGPRPFKPFCRRIPVEFTEAELEKNWQAILANKP